MIKLDIQGMICGHCRKAIHDALADVPGVQSVQVDLERGAAQVQGSVDVDALIAAVKDEGYEARAA